VSKCEFRLFQTLENTGLRFSLRVMLGAGRWALVNWWRLHRGATTEKAEEEVETEEEEGEKTAVLGPPKTRVWG
jgi:hypothetical protein